LPTSTPNGLEALSTAPPVAAAHMKAVSELELASELRGLAERHAAFRLAAGPGVKLSLFRDQAGAGRVLFVTNSTPEPTVARLETAALRPGVGEAVDALDGAAFRATFGAIEVPLSPHSVRMLELK
jgi:hypothetical protein